MDELLKKLKYKEGRVLVVNPHDGFSLGIGEENQAAGTYDMVLLFVKNSADMKANFAKTIASLNVDALFWVIYPKKSSKIKTDINRDSLWKLAEEESPYRPVSNVAVDETWSALRFRHADNVKSKK